MAAVAKPNVDAPQGEKSGFRPLTVTLQPSVYERLIRESARRKIAGEPNQMLSALLRDALWEYLNRLDADEIKREGRPAEGEIGPGHARHTPR